MRLWHYKLIPFLPKSQLLAQWRELNSIFKKQDKHILINYVYEYDKKDLYEYSRKVIDEFQKRGYKIKSMDNFYRYFGGYFFFRLGGEYKPFRRHHDNRYLRQCFYNLQEKYDRGQKDFSRELYLDLLEFVRGFVFGRDIQ